MTEAKRPTTFSKAHTPRTCYQDLIVAASELLDVIFSIKTKEDYDHGLNSLKRAKFFFVIGID